MAKSRGRSLIVGVTLVALASLGFTACNPSFAPTPCPTALYQPTSTFADGQTILNDCAITIHSAADVSAKRAALINFVWGAGGFPATKLPVSVDHNVVSPVAGLSNLERVDTLHIAMDAGQVGIAHHFIPLKRKANRLVVLHQGHTCTINDSTAPFDEGPGMQHTINSLLADGYSVLAVYMQHIDDQLGGACGQPSHDEMFQTLHTEGSVMKFFLEPVVVSLNYLQTQAGADHFPSYRDFSMIGLSGGGWTTVVYAAIDPRITLSVPVAGSLPLYLRFPASEGDTEQNLTAFYRIAGYPDLHVMGSYGPGRHQVQVLNRLDDCCFSEQYHDANLSGMSFDQATHSYEWRVRTTMAALGSGSFRFEVDEASPTHMISFTTIANVLLAELNGDRHTVGAASADDAFVRGTNGNLWHAGASGWEDTGLPMLGTPAVAGPRHGPVDVFFRDTSNQLTRATRKPAGWTSTTVGGVIITDPVAASTALGGFDVVALGADYTPHHWWWNGTGISHEQVGTTRGLGQPALIAAPDRLDIFVRGVDHAIHHVRRTTAGVVEESLGGVISDFPTAVATTDAGGTTRRVFVDGPGRRIWSVSSLNDGPWQWELLAPTGITDRFAGSPSASKVQGTVIVSARTSTGTLGIFRRTPAGWTYRNVGGSIIDSPTSVGSSMYAHGRNESLRYFDGISWQPRGGRFD
jgi:hypothetical protein